MTILSDGTFLLYAAKHYRNPSCAGMKEFQDDLKRFKYIKRLLRRYSKTTKITERLILNHIILLHNVFGVATIPLLFYKIEEDLWPQIKTFLVFLNYLPEHYQISGQHNEVDISLDTDLINKLRKI